MLERAGVDLKSRIEFEHDVILVELREYRRDLPLAEGVVERVVDRLGRHPQPRGGVAVDAQRCARGGRLSIGRHVLQLRQRRQLLLETIGAHRASSSLLPSCSVYWYCVLLGRPPTWMSCRTCMNSAIPCDPRQFRLQPGDDFAGGACRDRCIGFRLIIIRPWLTRRVGPIQ